MSHLQKPQPHLAFSAWKFLLRNDCELEGKLAAFDTMGDYVLELLWAIGLDPSVKGILDYSATDRTNGAEQ